MKKLIFIFIIAIFFSFIEIYADPAVFLNSIPGRAEIVIDGLVIPQKTPALIRNLSPGLHLIELSKTGYTTVKMNIELKSDEVLIIDPVLQYQHIPIIFPTYDDIQINEQQNSRDILLLEDGTYNFSMNSEQLRITPMYSGQKIINGLNISIPLLAAFSGAMTVNEIYNPRNADGSLSVFTLSSIGINAALIIADIILYFNRNRFYKEFKPPKVTIESEHPESLYATAEEMFAAGKLDTSLYYLNRILVQFPESDIYPYALYKSAKIKIIKEETDSAEILLNTLINEYPLPELYNSAVKSLADIFLRKGKFQESIDQLNLILFLESGITREEIDLQQYKILKKWSESDPDKYIELISHMEYMIQAYANSNYYDSYLRLLSEISAKHNMENQLE